MYRGFFDIIAEILECSQSLSKKANLISSCNLSFKQLDNYLDYLTKTQLLCTEKRGKLNFECYRITNKGKEFLNNYYNLKTLMLNNTG
jgi:predicted transcriptional regulator